MKTQVKERFWTKGKKTTISGIILGIFTFALIWTDKCSITEAFPLILLALLLFGVKDTHVKKFLSK